MSWRPSAHTGLTMMECGCTVLCGDVHRWLFNTRNIVVCRLIAVRLVVQMARINTRILKTRPHITATYHLLLLQYSLQRSIYYAPPLIGGGIKRWFCLTSGCLSHTSGVTREQRKTKIGRGSPHHTWLRHHFQGQKVKGKGHKVGLVGCSRHYKIYTDDTIIYSTAQSEPLPVDREYLWCKARLAPQA